MKLLGLAILGAMAAGVVAAILLLAVLNALAGVVARTQEAPDLVVATDDELV